MISLTPKPTEIRWSFRLNRESTQDRNVFCPSYTRCLDVAVKAGWEDWTCARCALAHQHGNQPQAEDYAVRQRMDLER
jgi:hypothetical protein